MTDTMRPVESFLPKDRTERIKTATQNVKDILNKYKDILGEGVEDFPQRIKVIIKKEREEVSNQMIEAIKNGRANDNSNSKPGIIIYIIKKRTVDALEKLRSGKKYDIPEIENLDNGIFRVKLPHGTYAMGLGSCGLYTLKDNDETELMLLNYSDVLRIEGIKTPTLWQNNNFNWDGTPKNKS